MVERHEVVKVCGARTHSTAARKQIAQTSRHQVPRGPARGSSMLSVLGLGCHPDPKPYTQNPKPLKTLTKP